MKSILQRELGLPILEIDDESATLEGGDVLFTGSSAIKFFSLKN